MTVAIDRLIADVRDLAGTQPTTQVACYYVRHGKPECIIGQAFARQGVTVSTLLDLEGSGIAEVFNSYPGMFDRSPKPAENRWLGEVQAVQDDEDTWEAAVRLADERYPY